MEALSLILYFPTVFFACELIFYLITKKRFVILLRVFMEFLVLILYPIVFYCIGGMHEMEPIVKVPLISLILMCIVAYLISYKTVVFSAIEEFIINSFLAIGIIINVVIACVFFTIEDSLGMCMTENAPIVLTFLLALLRSYRLAGVRIEC